MYELETARLHLRPLAAGDLDDYYQRIFADPEVMRGHEGARYAITREQFVADGSPYRLTARVGPRFSGEVPFPA